MTTELFLSDDQPKTESHAVQSIFTSTPHKGGHNKIAK